MNPIITTSTIWLIAKIAYIIAFGLYTIFAVVVVSQIKQMVSTLNGLLELPLKLIGYLHLLLALIALLAAVVIL